LKIEYRILNKGFIKNKNESKFHNHCKNKTMSFLNDYFYTRLLIWINIIFV